MKLVPTFFLPLLCITSLLWGSADVTPTEVWHTLTGAADGGDTASYIVLHLRLPAMLTAVLAGAGLAASGLVMQTVFSNPLADPSLLGINSGAALGAAIAMLLYGGEASGTMLSLSGRAFIFIAACIGAATVITILLALSTMLLSRLRLLVAGVMISFVVSSLITILIYFSSATNIQGYVLWGMGSFAPITGKTLWGFAIVVIIAAIALMCSAKVLNVLLLGSDYATGLGISIRRSRTWLLFLAGLLCAAITSLCGPVGFIGLAAPHVARFVHRTADHHCLLPQSLLCGADIALLAALLTHLPNGTLLPLNAITPLFGVPIVLTLIFRHSKKEE